MSLIVLSVDTSYSLQGGLFVYLIFFYVFQNIFSILRNIGNISFKLRFSILILKKLNCAEFLFLLHL